VTTVGRLEIVSLRELWRHDALDFTRWLVEHLFLGLLQAAFRGELTPPQA